MVYVAYVARGGIVFLRMLRHGVLYVACMQGVGAHACMLCPVLLLSFLSRSVRPARSLCSCRLSFSSCPLHPLLLRSCPFVFLCFCVGCLFLVLLLSPSPLLLVLLLVRFMFFLDWSVCQFGVLLPFLVLFLFSFPPLFRPHPLSLSLSLSLFLSFSLSLFLSFSLCLSSGKELD